MSLIIMLAILIALGILAVFIFQTVSLGRATNLAAEAKARAEERARAKPFVDTNPMEDMTPMDLSLAMAAAEITDTPDGRGPLTNEQKNIIRLIMEGHAPVAVQEPKNHIGASATHAARVPHANSIFGENQVEVAEKPWSETRN